MAARTGTPMRIKITMSPSDKAKFAIMALGQRRDLRRNIMLGGPTPPSMEKKNRKIEQRYEAERLKIIKRFGVIAEYAQPLVNEVREHLFRLRLARKKLRALQDICKHKKRSAKNKTRCADCDKKLR